MRLSPQVDEAIQSRAKMLSKKFPQYCEYEDLVQDGYLLISQLQDLGDDYAFGAINKYYSDVWDKAVVRAPFNNKLVSLESLEEKGHEVAVEINGGTDGYREDTWDSIRELCRRKLSEVEFRVLDLVAEKASLKDIGVELGMPVSAVVTARETAIRKLTEVMDECM